MRKRKECLAYRRFNREFSWRNSLVSATEVTFFPLPRHLGGEFNRVSLLLSEMCLRESEDFLSE